MKNKYPQVGCIYKVRGEVCYIFHCDNIFRIEPITNCKNKKQGWFQQNDEKEIPLTQNWLNILQEFDPKGEQESRKHLYDINSDYLKHWDYKNLNDYLLRQYTMSNIYDFYVEQDVTATNKQIYIRAKMKQDFFNKIVLFLSEHGA